MRDEEVHVPQLLATAHLFADEIVIVDTGSVDATKQEARKFTPHVYDFTWVDDFAAARNFGIERCTKDFVMWLDADDVVSEDDARRIRALVSGEVGWDIIMLPYHYVHDEAGRTTLLTRRERIFRNHRGFRFEYPVHECLRYPPGAVVANNTEINVHHQNLKRREPSNERNLRILRRAVTEPAYAHDFRMWWLLAAEEAPEEAVKHYRRVLSEFGADLAPSLHSEVCVEFARKLVILERFDEAQQVLGRAISHFPLWREPFFLAAQIHWRQQRFAESLRLLQIAGTIPAPQLGIGNLDRKIYDGDEYFEWLFLAHEKLQDREGMAKTVEAALARHPANTRFLERRSKLLPPQGGAAGRRSSRYVVSSSYKGFRFDKQGALATGATARRREIERQLQTIAVQMMLGADRAGLIRRLEDLGAPPEEARRIIETAEKDSMITNGRAMASVLRKRDWLLGALERQQRLWPGAARIERRNRLGGDEFLERYYSRARPVILTGEMYHWNAVHKWTPAYLAKTVGAYEIECRIESKASRSGGSEARSARMPFDAFIRGAGRPDGERGYMLADGESNNTAVAGWLGDDLGLLDSFADRDAAHAGGTLWIGSSDVLTPLHHDLVNCLVAQLAGRNRIKLVAAGEVARLYNHRHGLSEVRDLDAADFDRARFPLLDGLEIHDVTLEPGEVLFVPLAWWYQVRSAGFTASVTFTNFRWANEGFRSYPAQ